MYVVNRFQSPGADFAQQAQPVVDYWRSCNGCLAAELVRNVDDPELWAIVSQWEQVRDYRKAMSGYEATMLLTPVMLQCIDEPSAYLPAAELGNNIPRSGR